jgi:tripartite-type tricarboxylate transporter receptor subunit TctC
LVEKHLGRRVVLQNKPGATGAIATQFVYHSNNDGYTLLYGAENPQIYGVMGITELDYSDFETVILIGMETGIIIVAEDSKYNTLEDLIADATDNPGKVKLGTTGPGGLPFVVMSLLNTVSEAEFKQVPFDGDGPVIKALLGGHVDATITKLSAAGDFYEEGKIKILASVSNESIKEISDVPALGQIFPEYQKYLPWGPFYGVFVKKETPEEIVDILRTAYKKAFEEEDFKEFLEKSAITPIGTAGEEAEEFLLRWQSFSSWLMYDVGAAKISPDTLGIKRLD